MLGLLVFPQKVQAPNPSFPDENDYLITQNNTVLPKYIVPLKFQSLGSLIYDIVQCESGWREDAIGKAGEIGLAQFKVKTFEWFKGLANRPDWDINAPEDQLEALEWGLENNLGNHWTCWRKLQ